MIRKFKRDMLKRVYGKKDFHITWAGFQQAKYKEDYYKVCRKENR